HRNESVIPGFGVGRLHHAQVTHFVQQVLGHEDRQDGIHPVIGKALGRFVPDDVGNAGWHRTHLRRRGDVLVLGHNESSSEACFRGKIRRAWATQLPKVTLTLPWSQQNFLRNLPEQRHVPFALPELPRGDVFRTSRRKSTQQQKRQRRFGGHQSA